MHSMPRVPAGSSGSQRVFAHRSVFPHRSGKCDDLLFFDTHRQISFLFILWLLFFSRTRAKSYIEFSHGTFPAPAPDGSPLFTRARREYLEAGSKNTHKHVILILILNRRGGYEWTAFPPPSHPHYASCKEHLPSQAASREVV